MSGKCKHCWHFHVRGNSETGTCRAGFTSRKKHREDRCDRLKHYMPQRVEVYYTIHDRRGGIHSGIKDVNDALLLCEERNRKIRKELMEERNKENEL